MKFQENGLKIDREASSRLVVWVHLHLEWAAKDYRKYAAQVNIQFTSRFLFTNRANATLLQGSSLADQLADFVIKPYTVKEVHVFPVCTQNRPIMNCRCRF